MKKPGWNDAYKTPITPREKTELISSRIARAKEANRAAQM
jgi:hypothetical protein